MSHRPQQQPSRNDASKFPLIRDILKNYPPSSSSSVDSHPSSWLSEPSVTEALRKNMPVDYIQEEKTFLDSSGQLLIWGVAEGAWKHCLRVRGLKWKTLRSDLGYLFVGHDNIEPPVILGTETGFVVLVYMRSSRACEGVIADLDGAGVGGDITLRVGFATDGDLKEALGIQARGPKGGAD